MARRQLICRSPLRRHLIQTLGLVGLCHIASIFTIDSPKPVYHCPLDRRGLSSLWLDENCYWSTTYAEAREKFVSLGNRLKEQVRLAKSVGGVDAHFEGFLGVLDVQSVSYDIRQEKFVDYIKSLEAANLSSPQTISPEIDTVDALLLTLRILESEGDVKGADIIHSSGTHGVEGYLGSAVQIRFLHELFLQNKEDLVGNLRGTSPSRSGVRKILLIHSVNPYGMRHHRRFNENNVDLNRNVLSKEKWADLRKRDPNFVGYVEMDSILNPFVSFGGNGNLFSWVEAATKGGFRGDMTKMQQQDDKIKKISYVRDDHPKKHAFDSFVEPVGSIKSLLDEARDCLEVIGLVVTAIFTMGYTNAKRCLVSSQYHKPSGVYYGGGAHNENTWENSIYAVQHAVNEFGGFGFGSSSRRAFWIDVHTGLGGYGEYSILKKGNADERASSKEFDWITEFMSLLEKLRMGWGEAADPGVSAGYDQTSGFLLDHVLCPPPNCFGLTQEFGTRPGPAVAVALILENKGYHLFGGRYVHWTSWAFYPKRLSWRRKTLRGGVAMLHTALEF